MRVRGQRQSGEQREAQGDRTEGLEHAATLRVALIHRGRHPPRRTLALTAAAAAFLVGGDVLQFAEHVADRAQLSLHRLGRCPTDLRSRLRAHGAEVAQHQRGGDRARANEHCTQEEGRRRGGES